MFGYDEIKLVTDTGYINTSYVKAPNLLVENKNGTVNLYNTNKEIKITSTDDDVLNMQQLYNNTILLVNVDITSTKGKVEMLNGVMNSCVMNLTNTTVIVDTMNILMTNVKFANTTLNISDLGGNTIDVDVNGGAFIFFNDNIESNIVLTISGEEIKTSIEVASTITRGDK